MENFEMEQVMKRIELLEEKMQIYGMAAASAYATQRFAGRGGKYKLNVIKPRTFNEKLIWLRENYWAWNPLTYYNTDKYLFKYYTEKLWGKEHSIPLLGVWDTAEDIDFDILPKNFVIKRTLSGGSFEVKIVDKDKEDLDYIRRLAKSWLADTQRVKGRLIAERTLDIEDNGYLFDYKIFVINGKARFVYVLCNKKGEKKRYHCYYDLDWKRIPVKDYHPYMDWEVKKPALLDEMVSFAEKIGEIYPVIRVDMYVENDNFYIGELTDVSNEGMAPLNPHAYDVKWGNMIKLPSAEEIEENYNHLYDLFPELRDNPVFLRNNLSTYFIIQPTKKDNSLPLPPLPFMQPLKKQ